MIFFQMFILLARLDCSRAQVYKYNMSTFTRSIHPTQVHLQGHFLEMFV